MSHINCIILRFAPPLVVRVMLFSPYYTEKNMALRQHRGSAKRVIMTIWRVLYGGCWNITSKTKGAAPSCYFGNILPSTSQNSSYCLNILAWESKSPLAESPYSRPEPRGVSLSEWRWIRKPNHHRRRLRRYFAASGRDFWDSTFWAPQPPPRSLSEMGDCFMAILVNRVV